MYNQSNAIAINFDPSYIMTCMDLWRKTLDMEHPVADHLKVHLVVNRRTILENYEKTSSAWSMLLRSMRSANNDRGTFGEVCGKVEEFGAWAKTELAKLDDLEIDVAIQEGVEDLLRDPVTRNEMLRLQKMLKRPPDDQGSTNNVNE